MDHLDPAILRPGRIDRKIQYKLATKQQAIALFCRFYPESHTTLKSQKEKGEEENLTPPEKKLAIRALAENFAEGVPEHEFSTAELQGYLLTCKKEPELAVEGISEWVVQERKERADREKREAERKAKSWEARDKRDANQLQGSLARLGLVTPSTTATATVSNVGQQLLGSVREPTAMPTTTTTTTSTPIPNPTAHEGNVALRTDPILALAVNNNINGGLTFQKPIVNGTTDNRTMTPPSTLSSLT